QCDDDSCSRTRILAQQTESEEQISPQRVHYEFPASRADDFLRNFESALLKSDRAKSFLVAQAILHLFGGCHLQLSPHFLFQSPLLICSIRTEMPYPCVGSRAKVFRMSMSSVPWTRSLGLSDIRRSPWLPGGAYASHTGCQEENHKERHQSWRTQEFTCAAPEE